MLVLHMNLNSREANRSDIWIFHSKVFSSVRSKNLNLKYQRFTSSSWEDVGAYRFLVRGKNSVPFYLTFRKSFFCKKRDTLTFNKK